MLLKNTDISVLNRLLLYILVFSLVFERVFPFMDNMSYPKVVFLVYLSVLLLNKSFFIASTLRVNIIIVMFLALFLLTNLFNGGLLIQQDIKSLDWTFFLNICFLWVLLTHEKLDPGILTSSLFFYVIGYLILVLLYFFGYYDILFNGRVYMGGSLPNNLALNGVYAVSFLLLFLERVKEKSYLLMLSIFLAVILFTILIASTGSRSGFLSLLMVFLIYLIFARRIMKLIILPISIIIVLVFYENFSVIIGRFSSFLSSGEIGGRWDIIDFSLNVISSNFILGVGREQFDLLANAVFGFSPSPHNAFLEVFLYGGVFAFLCLVFIIFKLMQILYKSYKLSNSYSYVMLISPLMVQALSGQIFNSKIFFLVLAVIIASQATNLKSSKKLDFKKPDSKSTQ